MQRINRHSIHQNPCNNKILYPILKRSCSKQSKHHSRNLSLQKMTIKQQGRTGRPDSCRKLSVNKRRLQNDQQIREIKKKRSEKELSFLHQIYEHISIQNNSLIQQILVKDQKLDSLKLQARELKKYELDKYEEGDIKYWHKQPSSQYGLSNTSSENKFGKMEVILSAQSQDQCSLADNIEAKTPDQSAIIQLEEVQDKQILLKQNSFQRNKSSKNLLNENDKGQTMNCSKLDQLRKKKGLAIRKSIAEPLQLPK